MVNEFSVGMRAALGTVRLALLNQPPAFLRDGRSALVAEVDPPGAVIGRSSRADVVLGGGDQSRYLSNYHLLIQPAGGIWVVRDNGSRHGTTANEPSRGRVTLRAQQPLPLVSGMTLELAGVVRMRVELVRGAEPEIATFQPDGQPSPSVPGWISDPFQQELADLLTEPRRRGTAARLTAEDVAAALGWSQSKAHRVRRALAEHRDVVQHIDTDGQVSFVMLADAVALAFPYLTEPRG